MKCLLRKSEFSKIFISKSWTSSQISFTENSERFHYMKYDFESQNFAIFEEVVHDFVRPSDYDMI